MNECLYQRLLTLSEWVCLPTEFSAVIADSGATLASSCRSGEIMKFFYPFKNEIFILRVVSGSGKWRVPAMGHWIWLADKWLGYRCSQFLDILFFWTHFHV